MKVLDLSSFPVQCVSFPDVMDVSAEAARFFPDIFHGSLNCRELVLENDYPKHPIQQQSTLSAPALAIPQLSPEASLSHIFFILRESLPEPTCSA